MNRLGLAAAFIVCSLCAAPPPPEYGQRITAIFFEPRDQPLTRDQIGLVIGIRPGDTLEEAALGRAIERLWASGRYADIAVESRQEAGGVVLTFRTQPAFFIGRVTVEGVDEPPNPAQLTNAAKLGLGDPYEESLLPRAAASLQDLLRANGFFSAQVRYETQSAAATEEMNIRFIIEPGARARFSRPVFEGNVQLNQDRLARITGWQRWFGLGGYREVNQARVQQALERIRDAYRKTNHLQAAVRLEPLESDVTGGVLRPHFQIDAGPRVVVKAEGAKIGRRTLRERVPIYQERTVDRELLVEGQHNLEQNLQSQGYFDAKVSYSLSGPTPGGEQTIIYRVNRGARYRLVHIRIEGGRYFDDQTFRERLSIIPARFPRYRRGRFSQEMLDQDRASLEELYRSNGFRDVAVKTRVERGWRGKPQDIAAVFEIKEGPQWFVAGLDVNGVDLMLLDEIRGLLASQPGQPFAVSTVAADRDAVLNWYFNNGYPEATFDATITPAAEPFRMNLRYTVREGRRNFVREVLFSGLRSTRPELITTRIGLRPLQPLSQASMVETQRRLYDLGIFAKVDVAVQNPEGRERNKYVLLQVEEAKKYSLNLGFGAEIGRIGGGNNFDSPAGSAGFAPRGLIGVTRSNMLGIGHTASATLRASNIQQRLITSYLAPQFLGNERFNLTFSELLDRSRDIRTFTSMRSESSVQLGQKLTRTVNLQYRATTRFVFIDRNSLKIAPKLIPIFSQPVKTIVVSASIIQDRRDDPVDSHRGVYSTLDFGYAPRFSESSTNYTRVVARNSTYHPFRRELVMARTTSFGWFHNLSGLPVPLPENFYAGGASTHRGFPDNQAGPRDMVTGFPVGGQAFLFFQHELRFPLIGKSVNGVLFHDMGNVYSTLDRLSFRYRQRDREDFDFMEQAGGIGLRIKTPVGPLRLDFAYAPNSPRFVGFAGSRDDLIRGAGRYNVPQRVNPFQFHFSIGQAF